MGQRERHGHLAVVRLAALAAILARDADRVGALLGIAGVVDDPGLDRSHALDARQDDIARLGEHGLIGPGRVGEEVQ
jgi:hypothetical protein